MRSHIGSRRSFICRIKLGSHYIINGTGLTNQMQITDSASNTYWPTNARSMRNRNTLHSNADLNAELYKSQYSVVHITGYTKVWPPSNSASSGSTASSNPSVNSSHLTSNGVAHNLHMLDHHQQQQQQANMYSMQQMNQMSMSYPGAQHLQSLHNQHLNHIDEQQQHQQVMAQPTNNLSTNFHLIAIARIQMTSAPNDLVNSSNAEFTTRHDQNGVTTFVDPKIVGLLGYQPNEILKKPLHEFCVVQDQQLIKEQFKAS
jgi:hypothetical protein